VDISTLTELSQEDQQKLVANAESFINQAKSAQITDVTTAGHGADLEGYINDRIKKIEAQRKGWVQPLNEQVKRINAGFKNLTGPLQEAKTIIHDKNLGWAREQQRIADENARLLAEAARKKAEEEAEALRRETEARLAEERKKADAAAAEDRKKAAAAKRKGDEAEAARLREQATREKQEAAMRAERELQKQAQEEERIRAEADHAAATAIATASADSARGGMGKSGSSRKTWKVEVDDITKVEPKYLLVETAEVHRQLMLRQDELKLEGKREGFKGKNLDGYVAPRLQDWADSQAGLHIYQEVGVMIR